NPEVSVEMEKGCCKALPLSSSGGASASRPIFHPGWLAGELVARSQTCSGRRGCRPSARLAQQRPQSLQLILRFLGAALLLLGQALVFLSAAFLFIGQALLLVSAAFLFVGQALLLVSAAFLFVGQALLLVGAALLYVSAAGLVFFFDKD